MRPRPAARDAVQRGAMAPVATYDDVEPLIGSVDDRGPQLIVTFRCPVTGTEVVGTGDWPQPGTAGKVTKQARALRFRHRHR